MSNETKQKMPGNVLAVVDKVAAEAQVDGAPDSWAEVVKQGYKSFRTLVCKKGKKIPWVARRIKEELQGGSEIKGDYLRKLLVAEAKRRKDNRMLRRICRDHEGESGSAAETLESPGKLAAGNQPAVAPKTAPSRGRKKKVSAPHGKSPADTGPDKVGRIEATIGEMYASTETPE